VGIDASIDALTEALEANGVVGPRPPSDPPDLDAIDRALAPMSLPAQVRRFWERVDPASIRVWAHPFPVGPDFALESWKREGEEFPGMVPRALFLVGYESWACMSVELRSRFGPGGSLFEWRLDGGGFRLSYHELSDWLDRMTNLLLYGDCDRREGANGEMLFPRDPQVSLPLADATSFDREPLAWPPHWQRLSGIEPGDVRPRGATHTIAELLGSDPSQPLHATVSALVVDLAGSAELTRVRVSDGTGVMAINCPSAITALGPGMRRKFEFDVVVPPGTRRLPPDPDALEALADPVADISQRLMARYGGPATAVATAIRPLGVF
jgi:hypothetical protein